MRKIFLAFAFAAVIPPASAQSSSSGPQDPNRSPTDSESTAVADDPGRVTSSDRDGLSSRGGPDPTGSRRSFSATIGSQIYSPILTPVNSDRASPRLR